MANKKLNLSANGFIRRKDWDFRDDGTKFKCYEYGGLRISYTKYNDEYFVAIRDRRSHDFTYEDYSKTNGPKLEDEFNGVYEVDVEKLKSNCEEILKIIDSLNEKVKNEEINMCLVIQKLEEEIQTAEMTIDNFKNNFKWYEASSSDLKSLVDDMKALMAEVEHAKKIYDSILTNRMELVDMRRYFQSVKKYNYVIFRKDGFYLRELSEALNKQKL